MPADTLDPARLPEHVAEAKSAWRKHAQALTWEQKVAAIERMRERAALLKAARDHVQDIRSGLGGAAPKTIPHSFGFRPGIDPDKLNQLADDL